MTYKEVEIAELEFRETGKALGRDYKLIPFDLKFNKTERLKGLTCRPVNNFSGYFDNQRFDKEKIVLHFTVGHLKGDILSLTDRKRGRVSTPFVVARDGNIYQLFSSAAWSYHLGRKALGGNEVQSKISIGIELSNYGPLIKNGDELETVYSKENKRDVYCTLADTEQYIKLQEPYRGYEYYAAFTDEQYNSLIILLRYLTKLYTIPREFVAEENRFECVASASSEFKGICSHVNFRTDKFDISPAFDWERVIKGVQAEAYFSDKKAELKAAERELSKATHEVQVAKNNYQTALAKVEAIKNEM